MSLFSDILQKISTSVHSEEQEREKVAKIVSTILGAPISMDQCIITSGILYVKNVHPSVRLLLRLKQQELLRALVENHVVAIA